MTDQSTQDLLADARAGRDWAFGHLAQQCQEYLLALANREMPAELRAKVGASDLVQDTLLNAYRHFEGFAGQSRGELLAWLRQILLNRLADVERQYQPTSKRAIGLEVPARADWSDAGSRVPYCSAERSPSSHAIVREERERLEVALAGLAPDEREVLQWRNRDRLTFAAIAQRMGRQPDAVRKLWARAVERLRQQLRPLEESTPDGQAVGR